MTLDKCVYDKNTGNGLEDLIYGVVETVIRTLITRSGKQSQSLVYTDFHSDDNDYNWAYMKYEEFTPSENWIGLSFDLPIEK